MIQKRFIQTSSHLNKVIPHNLKGKSSSSQNWLSRQLNDPYVTRARYENYRARSAFKLIEMDDKYHILRSGMRVVECGAAPGAWTQVLVRRLKLDKEDHVTPQVPGGMVISVDINPISPVDGAHVLGNTDFTKPMNHAKILSLLDGRTAHLVCSDMAPNATGQKSLDHQVITELSYTALRFALQVLEPQTGMFLTKIWDGESTTGLKQHLESFFGSVRCVKPPSSRCDSAESFILATYFKGLKKK